MKHFIYVPKVREWVGRTSLKWDDRVTDAMLKEGLDVNEFEARNGELTRVDAYDERRLMPVLESRSPTIADYAKMLEFFRVRLPEEYKRIMSEEWGDSIEPQYIETILDGTWTPINEHQATLVNHLHPKGIVVPFPEGYEDKRNSCFGIEDLDDETGLPKRLREQRTARDFRLSIGKAKGAEYDFYGCGSEINMYNDSPRFNPLTNAIEMRLREVRKSVGPIVDCATRKDLRKAGLEA
mgnify:CR=1 FL=1